MVEVPQVVEGAGEQAGKTSIYLEFYSSDYKEIVSIELR